MEAVLPGVLGQVVKARALIAAKQYRQAEQILLDCAGRSPAQAAVFLLLAQCRSQLPGRHFELIANAREAIRLDPQLSGAYYLLAFGLVKLCDEKAMREADTAVDRAIALSPEHAGSWLLRGQIHEALRRHDDDIEGAYGTALRLDPENPRYLLAMGQWKQSRGEGREARRLLREVLRQDPENAEAHAGLALVALQRGHAAGAMEHARQAVRRNPQLPEAQEAFYLAMQSQNRVLGVMLRVRMLLEPLPRRVFGGHWNETTGPVVTGILGAAAFSGIATFGGTGGLITSAIAGTLLAIIVVPYVLAGIVAMAMWFNRGTRNFVPADTRSALFVAAMFAAAVIYSGTLWLLVGPAAGLGGAMGLFALAAICVTTWMLSWARDTRDGRILFWTGVLLALSAIACLVMIFIKLVQRDEEGAKMFLGYAYIIGMGGSMGLGAGFVATLERETHEKAGINTRKSGE